MDETYVKVKGKWCYLYRAVDKSGQIIDFYISKYRDTKAAKAFFNKALGYNGKPNKVTIDKSGANHAALKNINFKLLPNHKIEVRQVKYLNNIVAQDHRFIKKLIRPMKGFKSFSSTNATLIGIELHHMLRKKQHIRATNKTIFQQFFDLAA